MAKRGRKPTEFDYRKTALRVESELESRKKALVSAERALGKARLKHEELLGEVARLDMLNRSLKAVNDKTEPPQNLKYVYTYPQWVWYPPQPWIYYGNGYTVTVNNPWVGTTCNSNLNGAYSDLSGAYSNLTPAGSTVFTNASTVGTTTCSTPSADLTGSGISYTTTAAGLNMTQSQYMLSTGTNTITSGVESFVIDLSTGAEQPEAEAELASVE